MSAPSSVSSVIRRSGSRTPSGRLITQSPPPGSTLPRSLSPSNEPPMIGNVRRVPRGPAPTFCVGAVRSRRVRRGRERIELLLSASGGGTVTGAETHPASVASAATRRTLLRCTCMRVSQDLVDRVDRALRAPVTARHGKQSIQEIVLRVAGLKTRKGPEIVRGRVDALASRKGRDDVRRTVAKALRGHVDECAVVRLERDAQVELENSVPSEERPISATCKHL